MPWPPTIPPNDRTNATPTVDAHASDHNTIANFLAKIVATGTVANPFKRADGTALTPGTGGLSFMKWTRIGPRVFLDFTWLSGSAGWVLGTTSEVRLGPLPYAVSASYPTVGAATPRLGGIQTNIGVVGNCWSTLDLANLNRFIYVRGSDGTASVINTDHLNMAGGTITGAGLSYLTDADP